MVPIGWTSATGFLAGNGVEQAAAWHDVHLSPAGSGHGNACHCDRQGDDAHRAVTEASVIKK
jgi:hypothetical protein